MRFLRQILLCLSLLGLLPKGHASDLLPPIIVGPLTISTDEDTGLELDYTDFEIANLDDSKTYTVNVSEGLNYTVSGTTVTPDVNYSGLLAVVLTISDGDETSLPHLLSVTVTAVNDAPVINSHDLLTVEQGESLTITLDDLNVTDVDNLLYPLGFSLTVQDGADYDASGATITPDTDFAGNLTVPVQVSDGDATSDPFNLTVIVNADANTAPTAGNDEATVAEDSPASSFDFLGNDSDAETSVVPATVNFDPSTPGPQTSITVDGKGDFNASGSAVAFTPAANFFGYVSVQYTVEDSEGAASNAATITVHVTAVDDPPVIDSQNAVNSPEDQTLTLTTDMVNVSDPDSSFPTEFTISAAATSGAHWTASGAVVTPELNYNGTITVPVTVNDGTSNSGSFDLNITITAVNDAPHIDGQDPLSTGEDQPITIALGNLDVTDIDNNYPTGFSLTLEGGDDYTFSGLVVTPAANYSGPLHIPVHVNDGAANSNTFDLLVTVSNDNDPPHIDGQKTLSVNEDTPITLAVTDLNISDSDNTPPAGFTLILEEGTNYTFSGTTVTPNLDYAGPLTVPVQVSDGTSTSNTFNLSITVNPINDTPSITGQTAIVINEDTPYTIQANNLIVKDPDNPFPTGFTLTASGGANYTVSGLIVTPNPNFHGTLSVPMQVNDGTATSGVFNLSITVNAENDAPSITGQTPLSVNEDSPITLVLANLTINDPDNTSGFTLTVLPGTNYGFVGNTVTPASNYSGPLTVNVRVRDGSADSAPFGVSITVNPINDTPSITGVTSALSTNEEQPITLTLANFTVKDDDPDDVYPDDFTLSVAGGANYTVSSATVTPNANFSGTLTVPVRVNDGTTSSAVFNVTIAVNAVNDAPSITGQQVLTVAEDTPITLQLSNLTVNDPDNTYPNGFTLTASSGANYTAVGNTITPAPDYSGTLSVPVTVNDGVNNSTPRNILITVTPVNDVPRITGQNPLSTGEAQPITLSLSNLFVLDPDDTYPNDFTLFVLSGSSYSVSGTTVTPAANFSGQLLVKVQVSDGTANSTTYDLQVLVNSVNDPPNITGQQTLSVNEDSPITIIPGNLTVSDPDNTYPTGFTITVLPGTNYTFSGLTVTPNKDINGPITVSIKVNDGLSDSSPYPLQINVNPVNDAPNITGQQPLNTNEDQPLTIALSNLVVVDPDDNYPGTFTLTVLAGTGYTASGSTITPAKDFSGTLTVPVRVNDGKANSNTFNLRVEVGGTNDAPAITGQVALSTPENAPITVKLSDLTVDDSDDSYPTGFSLAILSGTNYTASGAIVTPALNFNGMLTVNVTVNDGDATSAVFPLQIQVTAVNTPPKITGQKTLATNEETPLTINLSDLTVEDPDDTYPNNFTLTVFTGANYTVAGTTITPNLNFNGNLTVPVGVSDGVNNSPAFNITVRVNPVNDAPTITGQSTLAVAEDQPFTILLTHLQVSDVDNPGYPSGFTLSVAQGDNYTVSGNTVTPQSDYSGNLSVNVTVSDGSASSTVYTLVLRVNGVNDAPTSAGFTASVIDEDNPDEVGVNLLTVFKDAEDQSSALTYAITANTNATYFQTIAINQAAGELRYKIKPNVFGEARVTVRATDTGGKTVTDVLTITINPINDAPSFDAIPNKQVIENASLQTITITGISKGALENAQNLNLFATSGNTDVIPEFTIIYDGVSATAQMRFTPQPNKSGIVNVNIFAIDDGSNALPNRNSFTAAFQVEVVEVNNAPTLNAISVSPIQEDAPELSIPLAGISAGPGETQVITITATHNKPDILEAAVIEYTSPNTTGTLKLKPKANASGTVQVTVTVTDDGPGTPSPNANSVQRQFNLVVQAANDLPEFTSAPVTQAAVGEAYAYAIAVTDVDNNNIALTAVQKPTWLTFTAAANGKSATLTGTPTAAEAGNVVIRLQAKDAGTPVLQEFTLNVNSRPSVSGFEVTTREDTPLVFDPVRFSAGFSDPDGNSLAAVRIVELPNPTLGQLRLNNNPVALGDEIPVASISDLAYQPVADAFGIDTLYFKGSDGTVYSNDSAVVRITITPVNDAPVIVAIEAQDKPLRYEIGGGPQALSEIFVAEDPDFDSLMNAEIGFRAQNYEINLDELLFTDTEHIKGTFNIQSGTLTLAGKAPVSEYNTFIRGITYNYNSPALPMDTVKSVYVTVSDGSLLSETKDRFIHLRYTFEELYIVGGFTPNGDSHNETWVPIDPARKAEFRDSELKIYDKRGRLLFETVGFEQEWDGTLNGELLPSESYFFTLDLKLPFLKKTYKGAVTILR